MDGVATLTSFHAVFRWQNRLEANAFATTFYNKKLPWQWQICHSFCRDICHKNYCDKCLFFYYCDMFLAKFWWSGWQQKIRQLNFYHLQSYRTLIPIILTPPFLVVTDLEEISCCEFFIIVLSELLFKHLFYCYYLHYCCCCLPERPWGVDSNCIWHWIFSITTYTKV